MKTISITKRYRQLQWVVAVVAIATVGFTSCSKESEKPVEIIDGEEVVGTGAAALVFNTAGIEDNRIVAASGSGMAAKATTASFENLEWQAAGDFDVQIAFSPVSAVKTDIQRENTEGAEGVKADAQGMKASNPLMANGKKYYLVIREKATGTIKYDGEHIAGTKKTVRIDPNIEYEWFAYSINENSVPAFISSTGKVAKGGLANKDVLYGKGEITPVPGDNLMNIVFKRNTVKYKVKLDVRGLFAQIAPTSQISLTKSGATGFDGVAMTGDLNVYDGTYSALDRSYALASTFANGDGNQYGAAIKEGVVYSVVAQPIAANTFAVGLPKLDLQLRDNGTARTHTPANIKMQHAAFTPKLGFEYDVSARLIESAIRATDSDAWWGRTNLTYREGHLDKYIFRADNNDAGDMDNDFWGWKTRTPYGETYGEVDPCSLVYPEGTWKMPTAAQGEALGRVLVKNKFSQFGLLWGATFAAGYDLNPTYNSVNTSYPNLSRNLYFTMYGYRRNEGGFANIPGMSIIDAPAGLVLGVVGGGSGYYWTDGRIGTSNKADVLKWNYNQILFGGITWSDYAEIVSMDFSHKPIIGSRKNQGMNVRCVRTVAPAGS